MNKERNICIVGLGLLGGSYAMGLTDAGYTVTAVDVRPEAIRYALEKGIIAAGAVEDFAPLLAGADAVVLGLYPHALVDWLRNNQKHLKPGALLTDVCGVKSGVVEEIQGFLRPDAEFIASHPMAGQGSERRGARGLRDLQTREFHHRAHGKKHAPGPCLCARPGRDAGLCTHHAAHLRRAR